MEIKSALAEAKSLKEGKRINEAIELLESLQSDDLDVLVQLFDLYLESKTNENFDKIKKIVGYDKFSFEFRGASRIGDLYKNGIVFEKDPEQAAIFYRIAIGAGATWKVQDLMDVLLQIGSKDAYEEMIRIGEMYSEKYSPVKVRLAKAYLGGVGVQQDKHRALSLFIEAYHAGAHWIAKQCVDLMLSDGSEDSLKSVKELCEDNPDDDWSKRMLIKMYWCGIGVPEDRDRSIKLQRRYINGMIRTVNPLKILNPSILEYDSVQVAGSITGIEHILSVTYQCDIRVKNVYSLDEDTLLAGLLHLNVISDLYDHCSEPLIITNEDYILCESKGIDLSAFSNVFVLGGTVHEDNIQLGYIDNPLVKNLIHVVQSEDKYFVNEGGHIMEFKKIHDLSQYLSKNNSKQYLLDCDRWIDIYRDFKMYGYSTRNLFVDVDSRLHAHGKFYMVYMSFTERKISDLIYEYVLGKSIYDRLCQEPHRFLFQMMGGIGDEYRRLCRTNAYKDSNDYVSVRPIIRRRSKDMQDIYGYDCVVLSDAEADSLSAYIRINRLFDRNNIFVIEPWIYRYSEKMSLTLCVGDQIEDTHSFKTGFKPSTPYDKIDYLPHSNRTGMIENAVLLNPNGFAMFARRPRLKKIFIDIFEQLAKKLHSEGFVVYTNAVSSKDYVISGTKTMFYSLKELISLCRYYRHIVTIETSIAELLSQTDCNLTVIHTGDVGQFMNVARMCGHKNCFSDVVKDDDSKEYIESICDSILERIKGVPSVAKLDGTEELFDYTKIKDIQGISPYALTFCEQYPNGAGRLLDQLKMYPNASNTERIKDYLCDCINSLDFDSLVRYINIVSAQDGCSKILSDVLESMDDDSKQLLKKYSLNGELGNMSESLTVVPSVVCDNSHKIHSFDIWGCCVSRDTFGVMSDLGNGSQFPSRVNLPNGGLTEKGSQVFKYQINEYYQGCPVTVDFTEHLAKDISNELGRINMDGALLKWFLASYNKDISEVLNRSGSEWLILDFRSEAYLRLLMSFEDGETEYCSGIQDLKHGKGILDNLKVADHIEVVSPNEGVDEESFGMFVEFVKKRYGNKIILIEARDSFFILNKLSTVEDFDCFKHYLAIQEMYIERFLSVTDCYFIKSPFLISADALHKWGAGGVHYISECYDYIMSCIRCIVESGDVGVYRKLDLLYAKTAAKIARILSDDSVSLANSLKRAEQCTKDGRYKDALEIYNTLAENGEVIAYGYLGRMYRDGKGVEKDSVKAIDYMRKAADNNVSWAKNELFDMLYRISTPDAQREMVDLITNSAYTGNGGSMLRLGRLYRDGIVLEKDDVSAEYWLECASRTGAFGAKAEYLNYLISSNDKSKAANALDLCKKWANNGDADMMMYLGRLYRDGKSVPIDMQSAKYWMEKASAKKQTYCNEYTKLLDTIAND